jgi:lipoprotein-anchoring transpeptidase ErfK/SrfK
MGIIVAIIAVIVGLFAGPKSFPPKAEAAIIERSVTPYIEARVSLGEQRMYLTVIHPNGVAQAVTWKVSTGAAGYETPTGAWQPTWLSIDHRSKTYDNAPMPFAVFFKDGYAVHATDYVKRLGQPASHGCVRLSPENAAAFFKLVQAYGKGNTHIIVDA